MAVPNAAGGKARIPSGPTGAAFDVETATTIAAVRRNGLAMNAIGLSGAEQSHPAPGIATSTLSVSRNLRTERSDRDGLSPVACLRSYGA